MGLASYVCTKKMAILIIFLILLSLSLMVGRSRMCNFALATLASPDTGKILVDPELVFCIDQLIMIHDVKKLVITSGYRTPKHNKKVGGASRSYHMKGMAIDCYCKYLTNEQLGRRGLSAGFTTAIVYKTHVHLDIREKALGLRKAK